MFLSMDLLVVLAWLLMDYMLEVVAWVLSLLEVERNSKCLWLEVERSSNQIDHLFNFPKRTLRQFTELGTLQTVQGPLKINGAQYKILWKQPDSFTMLKPRVHHLANANRCSLLDFQVTKDKCRMGHHPSVDLQWEVTCL